MCPRTPVLLERRLGVTGVIVYGRHACGDPAIECEPSRRPVGSPRIRCAAAETGSVAVYRRDLGQVAPGTSCLVAQGSRVGREGRIAVTISDDGSVSVGGSCVSNLTGRLDLCAADLVAGEGDA